LSTLVLARKYRPRSFDQMVGQEHVVRALSNALTTGRLHHAYLFTGTRGIGKTTVSRILAKSLNCTGADGQGGVTPTPCGVCSACTQIDADRFIDYIELDAASNRSIDEVRELIERAAYKPSVGRFKVFMIDEAHQLTKDAFNALLKTLEEPPDYLKFVLATTDPEKMLPTVLSRCLQFNLRPMAPELVREHLQHVLAAEGVAADEGALRLLARAARGSMRDALSLTDQAIAFGQGQLEEQSVRQMLGSVDRSHPLRLLRAVAARDGPGVLEVVEQLRGQGLSAAATLQELARVLQLMAVEQAVPGALDPLDPDSADVQALAAQWPADETQLFYSMVVHGQGELAWVSDEHAALTMIVLRLFAFPAQEADGQPRAPRVAPEPRAQALRALAAPQARVAVQAPEPVPRPAAAAMPAAAAVPATVATNAPAEWLELADRWAALVARMDAARSITALVRELAFQAGLQSVIQTEGGQTWTLHVESASLRAEAQRERLAAALSATLGQTIDLQLVAGEPADTPARRDAAARTARQAQAETQLRSDPLVQELLGQFKSARIVPGSIKPLERKEGSSP
jgi:DNA polymerase III subunit gamma/tau